MPKTKFTPQDLPILYIIHGWTYKADHWQQTLSLLEDHKIKVKFLHVPGLTKPSQRVWTMPDYVTWLRGQLKQTLKPIFLGHSNGGRIALNYCYQYPNHLRHLILLNSAGLRPKYLRRFRNFCFLVVAKVFKPLKRIPICSKLSKRLARSGDYSAAPENMKKTLYHMLSSDRALFKRLDKIKTPVSMIWGQADRVTPLWMMEVLTQKLANVQDQEILKDAGHVPYIHQPEALVASLMKILSKI